MSCGLYGNRPWFVPHEQPKGPSSAISLRITEQSLLQKLISIVLKLLIFWKFVEKLEKIFNIECEWMMMMPDASKNGLHYSNISGHFPKELSTKLRNPTGMMQYLSRAAITFGHIHITIALQNSIEPYHLLHRLLHHTFIDLFMSAHVSALVVDKGTLRWIIVC